MQVMMFSGGQWQPADDAEKAMQKACDEHGGMVGDALTTLGFEVWARIGADDFCAAPVALTVYFRHEKSPHFYIDIEGSASSSGNEVYAETLPDVMELLSLWAPMVQATSIAELIRLLRAGELEDEAKALLSGRATKRPARTS